MPIVKNPGALRVYLGMYRNSFIFKIRVDCVSSLGIETCYGHVGPGIESLVGAIFSAPVQTGPGAHSASYTMGTESLSQG